MGMLSKLVEAFKFRKGGKAGPINASGRLERMGARLGGGGGNIFRGLTDIAKAPFAFGTFGGLAVVVGLLWYFGYV